MPRWALHNEGEADDATSSDDEREVEEASEASEAEEEAMAVVASADETANGVINAAGPGRIKVKLKRSAAAGPSSEAICHVCGVKGHFAGFLGATYIDCVNKPCYLCGKAGHSTQTCPHRVAPGFGCIRSADAAIDNLAAALRRREMQGPAAAARPPPPKRRIWQVDGAVLKLHARRCTCLEFHPTNDRIVLSGDKFGQVAVWDCERVFDRTVWTGINRWLTNALRFLPGSNDACVSASYDGTVKVGPFDFFLAIVFFETMPHFLSFFLSNPRLPLSLHADLRRGDRGHHQRSPYRQ
jgi:DNA damage-binding protein 2